MRLLKTMDMCIAKQKGNVQFKTSRNFGIQAIDKAPCNQQIHTGKKLDLFVQACHTQNIICIVRR